MKQVDVVGAVIKKENRILCALRSSHMTQGGYWEFPGGKIEKDENAKEALQREIKEELGCVIDVGELIEDIIHSYPEVNVHLMTYEAKIREGQPEAREHQELRWIDISRLSTLRWAPADVPTVEALISKSH